MFKNKIQAIVLAAGRSTRFNTGKSKLIEKICGQEMILYATRLLEQFSIPTSMVVGFARETVQTVVEKYHGSRIPFIVQEDQKGTGHALLCSQSEWNKDHILIINGDMPLIKPEIIEQLCQKHIESDATITFITAHNSDPSITGYGRVIKEDHKIRIIEHKEFHGDTHEHCCINAGIYIFKREFLQTYCNTLEESLLTKEFYLTDLIKIASDQDLLVKTHHVDFDSIRGVNDFKELWSVEQIKRSQIISLLMKQGVRFYAPQTVHIDLNVTIGSDSYIGNGVHIINGSHVGSGCTIEAFSIIDNSCLENNVTIRSHSVVYNSTIKQDCLVGPFAHIDTESCINESTTIGNFVQIRKSTLGTGTKAKHLNFIGNANIGNNVNIGAGTITCNYNGIEKNKTIIKDDCFIGTNNTLIAPVTIETGSYTAGGSVITHDVPEETLAIGRARQINKEGYAKKLLKNRTDSSFIAAKKTDPSIIEST